MTMKTIVAFLVAVAAFCGFCADTSDCCSARSPDGRNVIRLYANPLSYEVFRDGVTVVRRGEIGMLLAGEVLSGSGKVARVNGGSYSGEAASPVYKRSKVSLSANWAFADYGDWGVRIVARNDGVAYRFETSKGGKVKVTGEKVSLILTDSEAKCFLNFTDRFGREETQTLSMSAKNIKTGTGIKDTMVYLPFVYSSGGKWVAVTESDVCDYPVWNIVRREGEGVAFDSLFDCWPSKVAHVAEVAGDWYNRNEVERGGRWVVVKERSDYIVETDGTRTFPWRVFALADEPIRFCESDVVWALARPSAKDEDFSWVKPGKVAWDWWNAFDNKGDPEGCTTETYVRFIDFAARTGVEYVILDEGWSESLNIWKYHPRVDVPHILDYAEKKGVGIILWIAWAQAYGEEAKVVEHFARLGVKGFKVDFIDRGDAASERFLWKFAEECRKAKLLVDYHGVHRPTGLGRTYPNVINYEGVLGLERMKWFKNGYDFMANDVRVFFVRMTAGPMDYTPGAMDNYPIGKYSGTRNNPGSVGTRCRQMAMMAMFEAPLQMLCDSPTKYEKNMECFDFMSKVPVVWIDTVGLGGCPDGFAAVARCSADGAWYAAAITDSKARDFVLDTSRFLVEGKWKAAIFRDARECAEKPSRYIFEEKNIVAGDKLLVWMAPGGGFAIRFERLAK